MTRVLVVEDSAVVRHLLVSVLNADPELEVVGEAADGIEAVDLARKLRPDVITMDIDLPRMDGLEATRRIMQMAPCPIVLVTASYDASDVNKSFRALETGALTILEKLQGPRSPSFDVQAVELVSMVKLMSEVKVVTRRAKRDVAGTTVPLPGDQFISTQEAEIVAVVASTGGPTALLTLLCGLPKSLPVPVFVVQHLSPGFYEGLVAWLAKASGHRVRLARSGDRPSAGEVVIGVDGFHLGVDAGRRIRLDDSDPIGGHRPSGTYLFSSVADIYGAAAVGVVLTGMGEDGVDGVARLKRAGGWIIAQDEATSVVWGMPGVAAARGVVDELVAVDRLGRAVLRRLPGRGGSGRGSAMVNVERSTEADQDRGGKGDA